ncbi:MAG: rhomboid family intramembrane serine protease [Cryomorphaceae bacterium]|nr:rhomboid family intramembrane serine protease [Cryomorphaceae bacterium]
MLPEVIKNLLIINGLFFLATIVLYSFHIDLIKILGIYVPGSQHFSPYQLVSHMFMHGGFAHILLNMFALWMFGTALENIWGGKRFLIFYLITGFGAAFLHLGVQYLEAQSILGDLLEMGYSKASIQQALETGVVTERAIGGAFGMEKFAQLAGIYNIPTVGASGAVFGILMAFGMTFPNQHIYLYFLFPIKAKYFVAALGLFELYRGIANDPTSNIAHLAHLGGMLFGFLLIKYWKKNDPRFYI